MSFVKKLDWFFKKRWFTYIIAISLVITANLLFLLPPKFIGNTIDSIQSGQITSDLLHSKVIFLAFLSVGLYIIMIIYTNLLFSNAMLLEKMLKGRLFKHTIKMGHSFFQRHRSGDIVTLATNDVTSVVNTAGPGLLISINTAVGLVSVIFAMIILVDYRLMLVSLIPLPFLAYILGVIGESMRKRLLLSQEAFGKMNNHSFESISGLRVIRSYVQEEEDLKAFEKITKDVLNKNRKVAFTNAMIQPTISIIVGFSYVIGIGYGTNLIFRNEITLGQLITFNIYLGLLVWPMISFGNLIDLIKRGSASLERIETIFDQKPDISERESITNISSLSSIKLKNLSFSYPNAQNPTLQDISLTVEKGKTLEIVGRTGSGKSTLLKLLLKQYPLESNKLFMSDVSIEQISVDDISKWIGYVPQEHMLLSRTIRENISFGNTNASIEEIEKIIDTVCLTGDIKQMRHGLNTVIGEGGVMLSGGQKQRIAIARALLKNPDILILDDVLSAVDAKTESIILHNLKHERAGKTTIIATHRLTADYQSDWIIVLENGRIIEEGTREKLINKPGWYKDQYYRQQLEAELGQEKKSYE